MSECDLEKFPDGLGDCISLEDLNLEGNKNLGKQPFSITGLKTSKNLNMSEYGLEKFSDGLENCISLEDLNLSYNSFGDKQFSIQTTSQLRGIWLHDCGIDLVPNDIYELPNLVELDMSSNKLKELPERFTTLIVNNVKFNLNGNVLGKPPQVICDNPRAILKYFKDIAKFGTVHSKRLRVQVIGNSGAGKTSLINSLLMGQSKLTEPEERTEGVEIRKWFPDPTNEDLELEMWDFGGHMEYQSVSHYFVEEHSLFLLVVDLSAYQMTDKSFHENAGKWIDELKSIVLRPVIMVAATKSDLVDGSIVKDRCGHMLKEITKQETADIAAIKRDKEQIDNTDPYNSSRIDKLELATRKRPVLPNSLVSASDQETYPSNTETVIAITSAVEIHGKSMLKNVSDTVLFSYLHILAKVIVQNYAHRKKYVMKQILRCVFLTHHGEFSTCLDVVFYIHWQPFFRPTKVFKLKHLKV